MGTRVICGHLSERKIIEENIRVRMGTRVICGHLSDSKIIEENIWVRMGTCGHLS